MSDAPRQNFFNLIRIQKDLEKLSGQVLARTPKVAEIVAEIAELDGEVQDFIYHWTEVIGLSNDELAAHFIAKAPSAFRYLDRDAVEDWIIKAMDAFDNRGLGFAIEVFDELQAYADAYTSGQTGCRFEQVAGLLRYFVRGLGGRPLSLACDQAAYTDSEKIYLPPVLATLPKPPANARLYKCLATYLWAQNRYGTWRYRPLEEALRTLDAAVTWLIYQRLECVRLCACIARDLPGLAREMATIAHESDADGLAWAKFEAAAGSLQQPGASAHDSLALVADFIDYPLPAPRRYEGEMFPSKVREVMFRRLPREKAALQHALSALQPDGGGKRADATDGCDAGAAADRYSVSDADGRGGVSDSLELRYKGLAISTSPELQELLASILQDLGEIGEDYLSPKDLSAAYPADQESGGAAGESLDVGGERGSPRVYPEWDYTRQRFREAFCALTEQDVPFGDEAFVMQTRQKYKCLAKSVQRVFEAILSEAERQKRQAHGDELDFDALVEAHVERAQGHEMSDRLYTHFRKAGRSVAVMFMVDMSGSTKGWVNDAERESLILLCEAVETLGDQYAIYGFSGRTNKRCEVYRIKTFVEAYSSDVRQRISGMAPKAYTRMGVAIRHLGAMLQAVPARTKLLIALSDGKPEDYGSYRGRYGIEDTRHALLEVKRGGIHPFCITIDKEAQSYLPHMYGVSNFTVVDEVAKLPYKVADIYRRLTT